MGRGDRLIIVANDGDPHKNFDRETYRQTIRAASDIEIHGVGLGPAAQLVLDLFPAGRGHWIQDAARFALKLRELLSPQLLAEDPD